MVSIPEFAEDDLVHFLNWKSESLRRFFWGVLKQIQADVEYSTNILGIAPSSKLRQTLPDTAWKISFHQELSIFKVYFSFARW